MNRASSDIGAVLELAQTACVGTTRTNTVKTVASALAVVTVMSYGIAAGIQAYRNNDLLGAAGTAAAAGVLSYKPARYVCRTDQE